MRLSLRLLAPLSAAALIPAAALAAPIPDYAAAPTPYTGAEIFPCENSGGTTSYKCDVADAAKVGISGLVSGSPSAGHCVEWVSATQIEDAGAACGVTVPGSNTQLLFNNSGALGAISTLTYTGSALDISLATNFSGSIITSWGSYAQMYPVSSTEAGLYMSASATLALGSLGLMQVTGDPATWTFGAAGVANSATGKLDLATLTANTAINLPDGGSDTTGGVLQVGGHVDGQGSSMIFEAPSTAPGALPVPSVTTYGGGAIGLPQDGVYLGVTGQYLYPGLTIRGWNTPETEGCGPFCQQNNVTFEDSAGNVIAGVASTPLGAGHGWGFNIGSAATWSPTAANEGLLAQQLFMADVIPDGAVEGPRIIWQPGPSQHSENPAFVGLGPESPTNINFRFGPSGNNETPWDDEVADQPDVDTAGCFGVGVAAGGGDQGGAGVTWEGKLCALAGGGVEVENAAKSAAAPIKASFYRTVPTTVSGLSTADASPADGDSGFVTDAVACTFNSAVTGSGSVHCRVHYDSSSSSWKAG